jgi:hypothetical protein
MVLSFNCGCARAQGLDCRDERDSGHPENMAHAHVYVEGSNSNQRKKRVRAFLETCRPQVVLNQCGDADPGGLTLVS